MASGGSRGRSVGLVDASPPDQIEALATTSRWLLIVLPIMYVLLDLLWGLSSVGAVVVALAVWLPVGGVFLLATEIARRQLVAAVDPATFSPAANVSSGGRLAAIALAALTGGGLVGPILALPPAVIAFSRLAIAWVQPEDNRKLLVGFLGAWAPIVLLVAATARHPTVIGGLVAWVLMMLVLLWLVRRSSPPFSPQ